MDGRAFLPRDVPLSLSCQLPGSNRAQLTAEGIEDKIFHVKPQLPTFQFYNIRPNARRVWEPSGFLISETFICYTLELRVGQIKFGSV